MRLRKSKNGVTTNYFYDGSNLVAEQRVAESTYTWLYYLYGVDGIAGFCYNNTTYLFRKNIQGDVTHIYTESGTLVGQYAYDAWGNCAILQDTNGIATLNPFRYRGYYFDQENDLYYLQSRYYDPETCRFVNADDISYLDPETIGGLNLYAYCSNNPVMGVDPEGTAWWHWIVGVVLAAAVAVATIATCGATVGIAAILMGAAVGAGYGAINALNNNQNVLEGAITGMLSGIIAGGLATIGTTIIATSILDTIIIGAKAHIIGGISLSLLGGAVAGTYSEINNQINEYGRITNPSAIAHSAAINASVNVISTLIGVPIANESGMIFALVSSYIFNVLTGVIGFTIDSLKNIFSRNKTSYRYWRTQ